jgi:hypothetical protein
MFIVSSVMELSAGSSQLGTAGNLPDVDNTGMTPGWTTRTPGVTSVGAAPG